MHTSPSSAPLSTTFAGFNEPALEQTLSSWLARHPLPGAVVRLSRGDHSWTGTTGYFSPETPYFIASVTKLFITTLLMQLREEGLLALDAPLSTYLSPGYWQGLHQKGKTDFSAQLTVRHLLGHRSGLPDYYEDKGPGGRSLKQTLLAGVDQAWEVEDVLAQVRQMKPHFSPGQPGKAHYSDTNFQLLGKVVEELGGQSLASLIEARIVDPLGLKATYLYSDPSDQRPVPLYHKDQPLSLGRAMTSFWADGGVVATAAENARFLQAFFSGELFPETYLRELQADWEGIFFPFSYGLGIARFHLPRWLTLFQSTPALIGHPGSSGSFAYYWPPKDLYLTGTLNQLHRPQRVYSLLLKLAKAATSD